MKKRTAAWVKKAEDDHLVATILNRSRTPLHDIVCFHCQQCAEKYLKGLMEELGLHTPRTHDLEDLLNALLPHHPSLNPLLRGLLVLSSYAVETRYLDKNATKREANSAYTRASRI